MRNPTWTRDELILLLEVYFRVDMKRVGTLTPEVVDLSVVLNELPIHPQDRRSANFRNPAGVHMKLRNLCRFDPIFDRRGLGRGGQLESVVWNEFSSNRELLKDTAHAIRNNYEKISRMSDVVWIDEAENEGFLEGRLLTKLHKLRERNPIVVKKKKRETLKSTGALVCEICGFDFADFYGDLGEGYAECHHLLPLSASGPTQRTKLSDLAIVCANCHRVLHRSKSYLSISTLKSHVSSRRLSGQQ